MTVLIVGAGGQLGRELLLRAGELPVIGLDHRALDIVDTQAVRDAITLNRIKLVINAAAYTAVDKAEVEKEQAFSINREGPATLARACAEFGIPLVHLSTDYVFDGTSADPYVTDSPPSPLSVYGSSKWGGEQEIRMALQQHLILRVAWVFGVHGHNFVKTILRLGRERSDLQVVADQRGTPTHAGAIADVLITLARRHIEGRPLPWGTWHYTGIPVVSWQQFAVSIFNEALAIGLINHLPKVHPVTTGDYPTVAQRPQKCVLDVSQTAQYLGVTPRPWIDGLREVLSELKSIA